MPSNKLLTIVLGILALLSLSAATASAQNFKHPGILVSKAQLDFVKSQVNAKVEPFYTEFQRAQASAPGALDYKVKGPPADGVVACGPHNRPDNGCWDEDKDSSAAYLQAVLWYITGNRTYAQNAIQIMNAYGKNLKAHTLSNAPLQAAWASEKWPRAAEIIRYSHAGWKRADIQAFSNMLTKVDLPLIKDGSPSGAGNWELAMIEGDFAIAVFTDDHALFDQATKLWHERVPAYIYYQPIDGDHPVPAPRGRTDWYNQTVFNASLNGMPQEACRDFHHTGLGLSAALAAAETAHIQGGKLYESEQPRLTAAMEFVTYYLLKNPVPADLCGGKPRLANTNTFVIGYNEYHNRLGLALPNTNNWIETGVMKSMFPIDTHMTVFEPLTHYADAKGTKPVKNHH